MTIRIISENVRYTFNYSLLTLGLGYDFVEFQKLIGCSIRRTIDSYVLLLFNGAVLRVKQELILIWMTSVLKGGESNINS
jgi:hypothetical protein